MSAHQVALRKESVDRNSAPVPPKSGRFASLSARRAWIEMLLTAGLLHSNASLSARRAWIEMSLNVTSGGILMSLSARRAWIEIHLIPSNGTLRSVALRKESVDRNPKNPMISVNKIPSLSARRAWIEISN